MPWRVSFVPNRTLVVARIVAFGMLLGTSVRADYLKCVNDEGKLAFVNTGSCPEGYRPSETYPEVDRPPRINAPPTDFGEKAPTNWDTATGEPAWQEWVRKKREARAKAEETQFLAQKSKWTVEGRDSTPEKVWSQMKAALLRGDIEGASRCFSPLTMDQYREMFQALGTGARVMAQEMKELIPAEKNDFAAKYWIPRDAEIDGRIQPLVFSVTFVRGGDGFWLIERF